MIFGEVEVDWVSASDTSSGCRGSGGDLAAGDDKTVIHKLEEVEESCLSPLAL